MKYTDEHVIISIERYEELRKLENALNENLVVLSSFDLYTGTICRVMNATDALKETASINKELNEMIASLKEEMKQKKTKPWYLNWKW